MCQASMCMRKQGQHVRHVDVMEFFEETRMQSNLEPTRARWNESCRNTLCKQHRVNFIPTKQTHYKLERQTCPSQVEGQTFPSCLKQNTGSAKGIRSLCSRTRWEPQTQIPTRSVHQTLQANSHESSTCCALHISILPTRSHTCFEIRTEQIDNRRDGDLQSPSS